MIEIDGSYGEGGGQILRSALALATLVGQPVRVHRIRAGRPNPGLAPQHLAGVLALASICAAQVDGARLGSTEIIYRPGSAPRSGRYEIDVSQSAQTGSAGAVTLILQTLLLPLALAAGHSHLALTGGTHVAWSPSFDYLTHVYLPTLSRMGIQATCRLAAWGFYPTGGGRIELDIPGSQRPTPLTLLERGALQRIWGTAIAANLPAHIAQRMANRATNVLGEAGLPAQIMPQRVRSPGPGAGLFLTVEYEHALAGFSALGAPGKPSQQVADEAVQALLAHHAGGRPVDPHLADQLLLPMALAGDSSEFQTGKVTPHLLTNAYVIHHVLPVSIRVTGAQGEPGRVLVTRKTAR